MDYCEEPWEIVPLSEMPARHAEPFAEGDCVTWNGRTYIVSNVRPDGNGWTTVTFIADPTEEPADG